LVDEVWHEHILHTREYAEFCCRALGNFLHHVPNGDMDSGGSSEITQRKIRDRFGRSNPIVWSNGWKYGTANAKQVPEHSECSGSAGCSGDIARADCAGSGGCTGDIAVH
jgi:hypothetical protein